MSSQTLERLRRAPGSDMEPGGSRRRLYIIVAVATSVVVVGLFFLVRGGTDKSKLTANKTPRTTVGGVVNGQVGAGQVPGSGSGQAGGGPGAAGAGQSPGARNAPPYRSPGMPVDISVSNTNGLKDGDVVHVHVAAKKGSAVYLFEAFLCRSGVSYELDADIRPTMGGNCVPPPRPLSAVSQSYLKAMSTPPHDGADGDFKVGVGTTTYPVQAGGTSTVTCNHDNPCSVVLKIQYPNGFGFDTIPLTYR